MKYLFSLIIAFFLTGCISTKSTLKNIDYTAQRPLIRDNAYIVTEYANDSKYAYDEDYPINIGNIRENQEEINIQYYFNGLEGPNGEQIKYKKIDTCCPFPTDKSLMGAGTLSIYEVTFEGSNKKITLYFNIYEKGKILCPKGFSIKQFPAREK